MAQPAIRYRNPGNLKPGSMAKGQNYWSQHGFSGISPGGFAQFDTNQGGIDALRQQLRIDRSRNPTLGAFLDKYVGIQADPTGTANAKINVPRTLGVGLDTPLQQIDEDALLRAMVISEGGQDSLQTYEPFMQPEPTPAPAPVAPSRGLRLPLGSGFTEGLDLRHLLPFLHAKNLPVRQIREICIKQSRLKQIMAPWIGAHKKSPLRQPKLSN
jgi:hypothetical protein